MSENLLKRFWPLLLIFVLAVLFRTLWLDGVPSILNRDEASIGYNAYSILQTGHDEYGVHLPFSFRSFGDYKLPGMIYLLVPIIKIFDLTTTAIRLPTALFGSLTILSTYWLLYEMGWSKRVRILTAILLCFSFWHLSQSRLVYEPILGLFWLTLSWAAWLKGIKEKPYWFFLAFFSYAVASCTYNVPWLLIPLIFSSSLFIKHSSKKIKTRLWIFVAVAMVGIFIAIALASSQATKGKLNVTLFTDTQLDTQSQILKHAGLLSGYPSFPVRVFQHKYVLATEMFVRNYLAVFNPALIYFDGDHNNWHSLHPIYLGNINPVELIFVFFAILFFVKNFKLAKVKLLLVYLLVAPLISATTITQPVLNRLVDFHLALTFLAAVGLSQILKSFTKSKKWKLLVIVLLSIWLAFTGLFLFRYFYIYDRVLPIDWQPGIDQVIDQIEQKYNRADINIILSDMDLSYAFIAFRQKISPAEFMSTAKRKVVGFDHVVEMRNYHFMLPSDVSILTSSDIINFISDGHWSFLLVRKKAFEPEEKSDFIIRNFRGDPLWYGKHYTADDLIDYYQARPVSSDRLLMIEYLKSCAQHHCRLEIIQTGLIPNK